MRLFVDSWSFMAFFEYVLCFTLYKKDLGFISKALALRNQKRLWSA